MTDYPNVSEPSYTVAEIVEHRRGALDKLGRGTPALTEERAERLLSAVEAFTKVMRDFATTMKSAVEALSKLADGADTS
jgi:hypothetical protein